jgi:hypothetical protein
VYACPVDAVPALLWWGALQRAMKPCLCRACCWCVGCNLLPVGELVPCSGRKCCDALTSLQLLRPCSFSCVLTTCAAGLPYCNVMAFLQLVWKCWRLVNCPVMFLLVGMLSVLLALCTCCLHL